MIKILSLCVGLASPFITPSPANLQPACGERCEVEFSIHGVALSTDYTDFLTTVQPGYTDPHLNVTWNYAYYTQGKCHKPGAICVAQTNCYAQGEFRVHSNNGVSMYEYPLNGPARTRIVAGYEVDGCGDVDYIDFDKEVGTFGDVLLTSPASVAVYFKIFCTTCEEDA